MELTLDNLRQYVQENNVTLNQLENITRDQLVSVFGNQYTDVHFENFIKSVRRELQKRKDLQNLQGFKDQLTGGGRVWLENTFGPGVEFRFDRSKRHLVIAIDGFGEETEDVI